MSAQLIEGEALAILRTLPDASVDALITDPPYSSGGAFRGDRMADVNTKYEQSDVEEKRPTFGGDTRDQRAFAYWEALWLTECLRIVKPGGVACVFTDWRQLAATTDAVQAGGWIMRGIVPWDKTEGTRPQLGRFRNQCEYIVWGSAGPMPMREGMPVLPGCFRFPVKQADKHHLTGKPTELMRAVCRIAPPGGVVLDPFAGSGTTGVAAVQLGLSFIGIEREPHYAEVARRRLAEAQPIAAPAQMELTAG